MGYVIFRGVSTQSLDGVYVSKMPGHKKAAMRNTEYYVKGRDGALHVNEGYEDYTITVVLTLVNASVEQRYQVNAWADGTGKLITSDDLTRAYNASVKDEVTWQRIKANQGFYDLATINFKCEPMMVEAVDSHIVLTETDSFINPGSAISYPLIQVNGSGDASFSVNGAEIQIDGMTSGVPVYIDCANGYVYTEQGATSIRGEIPYLDFGVNTVTINSGISSIDITPHWRWV